MGNFPSKNPDPPERYKDGRRNPNYAVVRRNRLSPDFNQENDVRFLIAEGSDFIRSALSELESQIGLDDGEHPELRRELRHARKGRHKKHHKHEREKADYRRIEADPNRGGYRPGELENSPDFQRRRSGRQPYREGPGDMRAQPWNRMPEPRQYNKYIQEPGFDRMHRRDQMNRMDRPMPRQRRRSQPAHENIAIHGRNFMALPPKLRGPVPRMPGNYPDMPPPLARKKKKQRWAKTSSSQTSSDQIDDINDIKSFSETDGSETDGIADFEDISPRRPGRVNDGRSPFRAGGGEPRKRPPPVAGPVPARAPHGAPQDHQMRGAMFADAPELDEQTPGFEGMKQNQRRQSHS